MAISMLVAVGAAADKLIPKIMERIAKLKTGPGSDPASEMGPLITRQHRDKVAGYVDAGVKEGAKLFQPACKLPAKGYYFRPTVFSGVSMSHRIAREEIFGPVLSVLTFRTLDEAVEKANNTAYGLSAGVWTDKGSRILKMSTELKAGVVWANCYNKFDPTSPFGGYKESGFGREGGRQGLLDYCKLA